MPLTVEQIMGVVAPQVMFELRKPYVMRPVVQDQNHAVLRTVLYDRETLRQVPIAWTKNDDVRGSEAERIELAKALLKNAAWSLDRYIEEGNAVQDEDPIPEPVDEGEDVVNDLYLEV